MPETGRLLEWRPGIERVAMDCASATDGSGHRWRKEQYIIIGIALAAVEPDNEEDRGLAITRSALAFLKAERFPSGGAQ